MTISTSSLSSEPEVVNLTVSPLFLDKFGEVYEITGQTWTQEVNQAGDDIWVIVHLYDKGVMLSNILNNHFVNLAQKYKHVKFVRGVAKVRHPGLLFSIIKS